MTRAILVLLCAAALAGGCNKNKKNTADGSSDLAGLNGSGQDDVARFGKPPQVEKTEAAQGDMRDLLLALKRVHFPFDESTLTDAARDALEEAAQKLVARPDVELWVDGHTDERGTTEYNMSLGDRRSRVVVEYLGRFGVAPRRLGVISYGEEVPLAKGSSKEAYAKNRRVEFRLMRGNVQLVLEDSELVDDDGQPL
jgi:peptidoglycan-associated lipoprotein